jgi:hypothetical protein
MGGISGGCEIVSERYSQAGETDATGLDLVEEADTR